MRARQSVTLLSIVLAAITTLSAAGCLDNEPVSLTAFVGSSGEGEVVLEWAGGPSEVQLWQYQYRRPSPLRVVPWGDEWSDIPPESAQVRRHRVNGLEPGRSYDFRVRPVSRSGLGAPSEPSVSVPSRVGPDGVVIAGHGLPLERGGTFRLPTSDYWTFRVPGRRIFAAQLESLGFPGDAITERGSGAVLFLEPNTGQETGRDMPESSRQEVGPLFDQIADSVRYRPQLPVGPLFALIGADSGVIVLEWDHHRSGVNSWQYRQRERHAVGTGRSREWGEWGQWSEWRVVPGSNGTTRAHRVSGLPGDVRYGFEVRPLPSAAPVFEAAVSLPSTDPGNVVATTRPARGRTFALSEDCVYDVPDGIRLRLLGFTYHPAVVPDPDVRTNVRRGATAMLDLETGSTLVVHIPTCQYLGRHVTPRGERTGVDALFDQIVESIRPAP